MNQNRSRFDTKNVLMYSVLTLLIGLSSYALYVIFHTPKKVSDVSFENNIKCSKYIEQENKKVSGIEGATLPNVFYSPVKNTCISAYIVHTAEGFTGYYIEDILANDSIYSKGARDSDTDLALKAEAGFIANRNMLKGEFEK